jgi:hypothetical protein
LMGRVWRGTLESVRSRIEAYARCHQQQYLGSSRLTPHMPTSTRNTGRAR